MPLHCGRNRKSHRTLYIANTLTRQLYFQDTLGDRPDRRHPVQLDILKSWLTNNVPDGAPWTVKKMPAPPQADLNQARTRGNDCGMGAIYGLMHYIQHGTMIAPRTCPNSRELFHTLRGWLLSVVLSGSLNPPSDAQYIPRALQVLASRATLERVALSSGPLDTNPEQLRLAATSEQSVTGPTVKEGETTAAVADTDTASGIRQWAQLRRAPGCNRQVAARSEQVSKAQSKRRDCEYGYC